MSSVEKDCVGTASEATMCWPVHARSAVCFEGKGAATSIAADLDKPHGPTILRPAILTLVVPEDKKSSDVVTGTRAAPSKILGSLDFGAASTLFKSAVRI